ncbi:MAG: LamG-like jellyroll fold domain-containing protein, partial [Pseudomonadota bacterium]
MNDYSHLFDTDTVNTPRGMSPAATMAEVPAGGIPLSGTGLDGAVYAPGRGIWSITRLEEVIADAQDPELLFTATQLNYRGSGSQTTVAEFVGDDAGSIRGNGNAIEMGPSGMTLSGFIYIPPGVHEIEVYSDDGYLLEIGGVEFSRYEDARGADSTSVAADFEGGLYPIDMLYFDAGGGQVLELRIDGVVVDSSAFFNSVDEFTNPPAGTQMVPVDDYHPSLFLGEHILDGDDVETGTWRADLIEGEGGDDQLSGGNGDDQIYGGYGDDVLEGGSGDDVLDGGRGSDLLIGGDGNDLLIGRSDAGITRIGQLAIGNPTRNDPDGEVNYYRQILEGYEGQPLLASDIMIGGAGNDTFLISPQINAKLEIIERHVRSDGTINWAGVAGENDELHDHWVDAFGIEVIADYNANEDTIAVIGHTANAFVEYRDLNDDGVLDTVINVISIQHGNGGAHDRDLLGQILVFGDLVDEEDIITDNGVTYGIVDTIGEVAEAIAPQGDPMNSGGGLSYDTRDADGGLGMVTGSPEDYVDNPHWAGLEVGAPSEPQVLETRGSFEQLEVVDGEGETIVGTDQSDTIVAGETSSAPGGIPGALGYWTFRRGGDGSFDDARGGPEAEAYTLYESQALLRSDGYVGGPRAGVPALDFNGEDQFAYIAHDSAYEVSQGTIGLWVRPDDLSDDSIFLAKDQQGSGDGGHFRLGHTSDGGLFLRMAPGDGGSNVSWETGPILSEGNWQHIAVSFTEDGVTVFLDGRAIPNRSWSPVEGSEP